MRRAMMSSACFWPTTRWLSVSASLSTDSISFLTMRPTGMPVQSWTTLATACSSTVGRMSGASPCSSASFFCSGASSARSAWRSASLRPGSAFGAASPRAAAVSGVDRRGDGGRGRALVHRCRRRRAVAEVAAAAGARSFARISRMRSTTPFSSSWRFCSIARRVSSWSIAASVRLRRSPTSIPIASSRPMISRSVSQRLEAALAVLELGRGRVLADGDARARGVEQAHRLVGKLARRDVAVREPHRRRRSPRRGAATRWCFSRIEATPRSISTAFSSLGSSTWTTWKRRVSAGSFSMCFLYSAQVVARDRAQLAARERGLEQVGGVAGAGSAARADQRVRLVDEQDDRLGRGLHLVDHRAQAVLELALHARAGLRGARCRACRARRP